jgi:hypothetical protein
MALSFLVSFENRPQYWQIGFLSDLIKLQGKRRTRLNPTILLTGKTLMK